LIVGEDRQIPGRFQSFPNGPKSGKDLEKLEKKGIITIFDVMFNYGFHAKNF